MRLPDLDPIIGDAILSCIREQTGKEADIILIAFPQTTDNPQPTFISSFGPGVMENIIKQIAEQLTPEKIASRKINYTTRKPN